MIIGVQENDEREWIDAYFAGRVGTFLELGAFDGHTNSLTEGLVESGWSGVMVEPDPDTFCKLLARHGSNERLTLVHTAVAVQSGLAKFWQCSNHQVSTLRAEHRDISLGLGRGYQFERPYLVHTTSIFELLRRFGHFSFDFVSIDIEGESFDVFREYLKLTAPNGPYPQHCPEVFCMDAASKWVMPLVGNAWECCYEENQVNTIIRRVSR